MDELHDISEFAELNDVERSELAARLVEQLGPDWRAVGPVAKQGLIALQHSCGVEFVAVPGGAFEMGWSDDDRRVLDDALPRTHFTNDFLDNLIKLASPTRTVQVAPFLCARDLLTKWQLQTIKRDWPTDEFTRTSAIDFVADTEFRLPTEAEIEWIARAGGIDVFTAGLAAHHTPGTSYSVAGLENRWGVANLFAGQWVADDWHSNYHGAPVTAGDAWMDGEAAGVFRGGLGTYVEGDHSLLYALAAHRSCGDFADGLIGMRLGMSLGS